MFADLKKMKIITILHCIGLSNKVHSAQPFTASECAPKTQRCPIQGALLNPGPKNSTVMASFCYFLMEQ